MTDTERPSRGRRFFNVLAAIVLILFALFTAAITVGVALIPHLRRAAADRVDPPSWTP